MCGIWGGLDSLEQCGEKSDLTGWPGSHGQVYLPVFGLMLIPLHSADPCTISRGQASDGFSRLISTCSVFLDAIVNYVFQLSFFY